MPESEFGIEVPEADRLEQLRHAALGAGAGTDVQDDPPALDTSDANPADVIEQHLEVPRDDYEDW